MFEFTMQERDRRWQKVRGEMAARDLGALVVWDSFGGHGRYNANLRYLSDCKTEGYLVFPLEAEPVLVIFLRSARSPWVAQRRTGHPNYSETIAEILQELRLEKAGIGIVSLSGYYGQMGGFPHATYRSLAASLPGARFEDATDILEEARRVKSDEEIRCIELGCAAANRVIGAVADTAGAGATDHEVRATIMDTLFRSGCEPASMLLYSSGKAMSGPGGGGHFESGGDRSLEPGDVILTEFDAQYHGYVAQHNQPFSVGEPDRQWREIFRVASEAYHNGLDKLKPGITVGRLDEAFLSVIRASGYVAGYPQFHNSGLGGVEEPIGAFTTQPGYKPKTSPFKVVLS